MRASPREGYPGAATVRRPGSLSFSPSTNMYGVPRGAGPKRLLAWNTALQGRGVGSHCLNRRRRSFGAVMDKKINLGEFAGPLLPSVESRVPLPRGLSSDSLPATPARERDEGPLSPGGFVPWEGRPFAGWKGSAQHRWCWLRVGPGRSREDPRRGWSLPKGPCRPETLNAPLHRRSHVPGAAASHLLGGDCL